MNGVRGEVRAILGGAERQLCLTLGALAEIETALGVDGLEALAARLKALSARDLVAVLAALLRGGGERDLAEQINGLKLDPREAAQAVSRAFLAAAE